MAAASSPTTHATTVSRNSGPGLIRITIANEPNPIVLTMRPDGGLTGPGLIDVKGRIIVGYFTRPTMKTV